MSGYFHPTVGWSTHLSPQFEHIFECNSRRCQLVLQHHYNIVLMVIHLLELHALGCLRALLNKSLKCQDLLVDVGNVLFDNEGQFLR